MGKKNVGVKEPPPQDLFWGGGMNMGNKTECERQERRSKFLAEVTKKKTQAVGGGEKKIGR